MGRFTMGRCKNYEDERQRVESLDSDYAYALMPISNHTHQKANEETQKTLERGVSLYGVTEPSGAFDWKWDFEMTPTDWSLFTKTC